MAEARHIGARRRSLLWRLVAALTLVITLAVGSRLNIFIGRIDDPQKRSPTLFFRVRWPGVGSGPVSQHSFSLKVYDLFGFRRLMQMSCLSNPQRAGPDIYGGYIVGKDDNNLTVRSSIGPVVKFDREDVGHVSIRGKYHLCVERTRILIDAEEVAKISTNVDKIFIALSNNCLLVTAEGSDILAKVLDL